MTDDMRSIKDDIKTLYETRADHSSRIMLVESTIKEIRTDQKEMKEDIKSNHTAILGKVEAIKDLVTDFRGDLQNIPCKKETEIEANRVKSEKNGNTILKWMGGLSVLMFLIMAYLAWKQVSG